MDLKEIMDMLHRISASGLLVGWLTLAIAAKTLRGDAAGLWILLEPILALGLSILLLSSIGVLVATFSSRAANRHQPSQQDTKNHTA
jgi:hypothetical protein